MSSDVIRVSGVVSGGDGDGDDPELGDTTAVTMLSRTIVSFPENGQELGRREHLGSFVIELDDGTRARVDVPKTAILEPEVTKEVRWRDVRDFEKKTLPALKPTPKPEREVAITHAVLLLRARVEVLGVDAEYSFEEATDHRSVPVRRLVRVTAQAIASGEDANETIERIADDLALPEDERKKKKRRTKNGERRPLRAREPPYIGGYVGAGIAAFFILGALLVPFSPLAVDLAAIGVTFVAFAITLWAVAKRPIMVRKNAEERGRDQTGPMIVVALGPAFAAWLFALMADFPAMWDPGSIVNLSVLCCIATSFTAVAFLWFLNAKSTREDFRLLRLLLDAPPLPEIGELRAKWGSFEGIVRDPTPIKLADDGGESRRHDAMAVAIAHVVDETITPDSNPNIYVERILSAGTFFVDDDEVSAGAVRRKSAREHRKLARSKASSSYEVHPKDAIWASALRIETRPQEKAVRYVQAIPIGGSILIAGRATRDASPTRENKTVTGKLASTGTESLVFFAAPEGQSARRTVQALLRTRLMVLAIVALCGASGIALTVFAHRTLRPFHMGATGGGD